MRIVTVDPVPPLPPSWRERIESYGGLHGLFDRVEVEFARGVATGLEVSEEDSFVATHLVDGARSPPTRRGRSVVTGSCI